MDAPGEPLGADPMTFARPDLLWVAVLFPLLLATGLWLYARRRRRVAELFSDAHLLHRLGGEELRRFPGNRLMLVTLAGLALGLAAAGPRWGVQAVEGRPLALNVALVADISRSMLVQDVEPNRLERARLLSRRLLRELPGDRFGLVVFAGRSYTLSPLTVDHSAIDLYIDALDPAMVSMGGSSMGDALRQATDLLRGAQIERGDRVIVLLSDGEVTEEVEDVRAAAERAARAGVRVMAVGFGTPGGGTIEVTDPDGGETRVVRNEFGDPHISRLDDSLLREVASRTGGSYFRADDPVALVRLVSELRGLQRGEGEAGTRMDPVPRGPLLAGLGVLLLMLDTFFSGFRPFRPRRRGMAAGLATSRAPAVVGSDTPAGATNGDALGGSRGRRRSAARAGRAALVLLALATLPAFGPGELERGNRLYREGRYEEAVEAYRRVLQGGRSGPEVHYNLGTALLATGNYEEAERHLQAALQAVDPELRNRTFYNLGNRFLEEGRRDGDGERQGRLLDAAIEAYRRALRLAPADAQAKWNLELALREREQNRQQQSTSSPEDPQAGDDGQDQEDPREQQPGEGGMGGQAPAGQGRDAGAESDQRPMSREEADRILAAIEQDERDLTRERLRRGQRSVPALRDW
jgi:Ca-activated chloride channel homolog